MTLAVRLLVILHCQHGLVTELEELLLLLGAHHGRSNLLLLIGVGRDKVAFVDDDAGRG